MKLRSGLYRAGSALGNVKAVTSGHVPQRVARVGAGRAYGRGLCVAPVVCCR
jgi:hypothetical protein